MIKIGTLKKYLSFILIVVMVLTMNVFALAAENTSFTDVSPNAWYADSVNYVKEQGLMAGTGATTFAPETNLSRGMLVTVLHRFAGSPVETGGAAFTDVAANQWYTQAVAWAANNGIVSGYGNGLFGTNDPVTREQLATVLWRYQGNPAVSSGALIEDNAIPAYAREAMAWARGLNIIKGEAGNVFATTGNATRAEVAATFHKLMTLETSNNPSGKALVIYFTRANNVDQEPGVDAVSRATFNVQGDEVYGNTELLARYIQDSVDVDLLPLRVSSPYPYDVDATIQGINANGDSRTITTTIENIDQYDVIFIGFPIWYSTMPVPVSKFLEAQDFSGKTIVPFSTHRGSRFGNSLTDLAAIYPDSTILEGYTVDGEGAINAKGAVTEWLKGLKLAE